jgi:hypothetical protein
MEDAYVIKRSKVGGWFWVSLILFFVCTFQYSWLAESERLRGKLRDDYMRIWKERIEYEKIILENKKG